jgi:hypothetical protein
MTGRSSVAHVLAAVLLVGPLPPSPPDSRKDPKALERKFAALSAALRIVPRESFDPKAVVAITGAEPQSILRWVRDETSYVAYRGALRGAVGVLQDRSGNSLDRALLLGELLQLSGHEVRLARATLSEKQANILLARIGQSSRSAAPRADVDASAVLDDLAGKVGVDAASVREAIAQNAQQGQLFTAELSGRVQAQVASMSRLLAGTLRANAARERSLQRDALTDHWWIQSRRGDGWLDLDPTFPDAHEGPAQGIAAETLPFGSVEQLPASAVHSVQLRVILECSEAGTLAEHALLTSDRMSPITLLGRMVRLRHVPSGWPRSATLSHAARFKEVLSKQDQWYPVLDVGNQRTQGLSYTGECRIGPAARGVASVLEGLQRRQEMDRAEQRASGAVPPTVTAEWLEYTIYASGVPPKVVRRQIFDLLGPAARTARQPISSLTSAQRLTWRLAVAGQTDILILGSDLSPEYVTSVVTNGLLANRRRLMAIWRRGPDDFRVQNVARLVPGPSSELYALALGRRGLEALSGTTYLAAPNILTYHRQLRETDQGDVTLLEAFDIVANDVTAAWDEPQSTAVRLRQGVLDTNAEALVTSALCAMSVAGVQCETPDNTSDAYAHSLAQGSQWRLIRREPELTGVSWPKDVWVRVRDDLTAGYLVILSDQRGAPATWWRIHPESGNVIGFGSQGWGCAPAETAILLANLILPVLTYVSCLKPYDDKLASHQSGEKIVGCFIGLQGTLITHLVARPGVTVIVNLVLLLLKEILLSFSEWRV